MEFKTVTNDKLALENVGRQNIHRCIMLLKASNPTDAEGRWLVTALKQSTEEIIMIMICKTCGKYNWYTAKREHDLIWSKQQKLPTVDKSKRIATLVRRPFKAGSWFLDILGYSCHLEKNEYLSLEILKFH